MERLSSYTGNTPLLKLPVGDGKTIWGKAEFMNPGGSVKDRMAKFIIDDAEKKGLIKPGDTLCEATSGNTGIALAMVAAERGYKMEIFMPSNMSEERVKMFTKYGANLRKNSVKEERELIQQQLKLFKDCNAPCIVFAEVSGSIQGDPNRKLSTRPQMSKEEWVSFCEKISEMGKYLEGEGMPLAYHHHMGTVIETQADTERLMESTNESVKLTLDTGHMLFAQGNSTQILSNFIEKIIHIHCKDIRKNVLENSLKNDLSFRGAFLEGAFTVPGDGCIDYKPLFDILKEKNYSRWLVVEAEQDPSKANPLEYAIKGYEYLTKTLKSSGIEF